MSADTDRLAAVADLAVQRQLKKTQTKPKGEIADFGDPPAAARSIVVHRYQRVEGRTLHYWQGELHEWTGAHWGVLPQPDVRAMLYREGEPASSKPLKKKAVDDVLDALRAEANLSQRDVPSAPAWVPAQPSDPPAREVIPLRNGLLHIESRALLPATPRYFVPYSLPIDYSEETPSPEAWIEFLGSLWPEDFESAEALQEWMGYLLTADTSLQKALAIIGPPRSGKGTIARVLTQLLGESNIASPTLASLGLPFGLQALIGKTACIMSDARLGKQADIAAIAENLLRLTGEDWLSVARKFREDYTARLLARVVVLANEVPTFRDAAAALPSRFIILRTMRSFYGREDHQLDAKLTAELPGILSWALDGLHRLRQRGRFLQPRAGLDEVRLMQDLASPIGTFLREVCVLEPGAEVPVFKLYTAWRDWCKEHGRDQPGTEQTFGRDMAAAVPDLQQRRPRIEGQRVRMYSGLRLRSPDDPPEDDDDDD